MSFKSGAKYGGAFIGAAALVLIVMLLVGSMYVFGWGFFKRATADFRGETAQTEQVYADPNFRISAYERFYDLCASIQSKEDNLENLNDELAASPTADREAQLRATITAVKNARNESIRKYNADARKEDTRGAFLASDLPYQIDPEEEKTTCTV